jgi:TrmH family RNA methyltransferase
MGSLFRVKACVIEDVASAVAALRACGRRVLAAELREGAVSLAEAALMPSDCVIIGNEGHGIPTAISDLCDKSVYLPISENAESLNAAVAAAIFLWEQSKL